jgi:hypothetical protein
MIVGKMSRIVKKNTMYRKGKWRGLFLIYKVNALVVYFIKAEYNFFFLEFFSLE